MSLSVSEIDQMQYLLGKARNSSLSYQEQDELRNLIIQEQPSAKNSSIEELIKLGLIFIGMYVLAKAFEKSNKQLNST